MAAKFVTLGRNSWLLCGVEAKREGKWDLRKSLKQFKGIREMKLRSLFFCLCIFFGSFWPTAVMSNCFQMSGCFDLVSLFMFLKAQDTFFNNRSTENNKTDKFYKFPTFLRCNVLIPNVFFRITEWNNISNLWNILLHCGKKFHSLKISKQICFQLDHNPKQHCSSERF